jgi:hypothetical protein
MESRYSSLRTSLAGGAFETRRATEAGRRVAKEVVHAARAKR